MVVEQVAEVGGFISRALIHEGLLADVSLKSLPEGTVQVETEKIVELSLVTGFIKAEGDEVRSLIRLGLSRRRSIFNISRNGAAARRSAAARTCPAPWRAAHPCRAGTTCAARAQRRGLRLWVRGSAGRCLEPRAQPARSSAGQTTVRSHTFLQRI